MSCRQVLFPPSSIGLDWIELWKDILRSYFFTSVLARLGCSMDLLTLVFFMGEGWEAGRTIKPVLWKPSEVWLKTGLSKGLFLRYSLFC